MIRRWSASNELRTVLIIRYILKVLLSKAIEVINKWSCNDLQFIQATVPNIEFLKPTLNRTLSYHVSQAKVTNTSLKSWYNEVSQNMNEEGIADSLKVWM